MKITDAGMGLQNSFKLLFTLLLFLTGIGSLSPVTAQNSAEFQDEAQFTPSLTISGSFAPISFKAWGKVQNSRQLYLKIGYQHTEMDLLSIRTQLSSEIIVSGLVHYPIDGRNGDRNTLFGFGLVPLIANIPLSQNSDHPFITTSTGFIVTHSHFPNIDGARFNFLLGLGAGYEFNGSGKRAYQVGGKLSHMSNGFTAPENPGIDSVMLFINFLL